MNANNSVYIMNTTLKSLDNIHEMKPSQIVTFQLAWICQLNFLLGATMDIQVEKRRINDFLYRCITLTEWHWKRFFKPKVWKLALIQSIIVSPALALVIGAIFPLFKRTKADIEIIDIGLLMLASSPISSPVCWMLKIRFPKVSTSFDSESIS